MGKSNFNGELLHCGALRYRVTGSGVLRTTLRSLDDVRSATLPTHTLASVTNREPVILANFVEQRMQIEIGTTALNEVFKLSKLTVFIRPVATGYPQ